MKQSKISKTLDTLLNSVGDNDSVLALVEEEKGLSFAISNDKDVEIAATLAAIITTHLQGTEDEGVNRLAEVLINTFRGIFLNKKDGATKLFAQFVADMMDSDIDFDDDEEDLSCEDCRLVRVCDDEKAITYRKEHGIQRRKSRKRHEDKTS